MSDRKSKHTWWCITKIAAAIIFSYPLCGVAAATWMLFRDFPSTIRHPWQSLLHASMIAIWYGVSAPVHGVLPEVDSAGHYHFPAYPFVIPTALVLVFVLFRGWRLLKVGRYMHR
ncbi:hypothetical protein FSO04_39305 [Paraburkholderia madseniana]|uniref:Uncharacterized protein n=1 Tax=Paraburkholderia madseniana TaxID=2599607 RepID=A0A6N6W1K0_9BURK|nr:hypothetical protein [Paraburkholderia madseniana]KAE8754502.1 hypothetical protein FSO04_39305 [Paraburkholderia madseniana]